MPDFLVTLPQGFESLLELKVIGGGPSHYASGDVSRCRAVASRARAIPQEYRTKAARLDRQYLNVAEGSPGPISQKLASYGQIWGLAFGAYGEASPDVHELVQTLARSHAERNWVHIGGRDPQEAASILARSLYRSWGVMAVRSQARVKLANLAHVGAGSAVAHSPHVGSEAFHARRREEYQLHHAAQRLR